MEITADRLPSIFDRTRLAVHRCCPLVVWSAAPRQIVLVSEGKSRRPTVNVIVSQWTTAMKISVRSFRSLLKYTKAIRLPKSAKKREEWNLITPLSNESIHLISRILIFDNFSNIRFEYLNWNKKLKISNIVAIFESWCFDSNNYTYVSSYKLSI